MAGTIVDESILSNFDQIYNEFKNGILEMQLLRSNCDTEIKKREALQFVVQSLQLENERLTNLYTESLNKLADQIENHVSCQNLKEELKRVGDEHNRKETEYRTTIKLMNRDHAIRNHNLESQIRLLHSYYTCFFSNMK
ncbi:hypothetical protein LIER_43890 [Lithospermum erythrorhizon]|uniref:Uncharacterized protein n=1 Tax=Lithospermum erythrorhizon TaxID=34254 RepID=A0AAV3R3R2_LITER